MAQSSFLYKPASDGGLNPGGASFLISDRSAVEGAVYDAEGNLVRTLTRSDIGHTSGGGPVPIKFYSKEPGTAFGPGFTFKVKYRDGREESYNIGQSNSRYEGSLGDPESLRPTSGRGNIGPGGVVSGGPGGAFNPMTMGQGYGVAPGYVGGMFPTTALATYSPIDPASYKYTDPADFAKQFGTFNREEFKKNEAMSKDVALSRIQTELEGLESFVAGSSALKRAETAKDNLFNQAEREAAVERAIPGAAKTLADQRGRAEAYASGNLPDSFDNAALEMGIRSRAADLASSGGFGTRSSVARKTADLLSAEQRLGIATMGEGLISKNLSESAQLLMAPTSYADVGAQIRTTPSLTGSQLASSVASELGNATMISAGTGLQSELQQQQFKTNLFQSTNTFNAANMYNASLANAQMTNSANQALFGYNVSYAGAVAGAMQTDINTQVGIQQQELSRQVMQDMAERVRTSTDASTISSTVTSLFTTLGNMLLSKDDESTEGDAGKKPENSSEVSSWLERMTREFFSLQIVKKVVIHQLLHQERINLGGKMWGLWSAPLSMVFQRYSSNRDNL